MVNVPTVEKKEDILNLFINYLKKEHNLSPEDIYGLISKKKDQGILIPTSLFANSSLSVLEAVTKHLKENRGMKYSEIAQSLNRDDRTIWVTYKRAASKLQGKLRDVQSDINIPLSIFKNRKIGALEAVSLYLKDNLNLTYHQAAVLLQRNDRTIWTACSKAREKMERDHAK
jgi:predicted DNA-binding protein (UPF0251 family)